MTEITEPTIEELRARARDLEIEGRSKLTTREELEAAIANAEALARNENAAGGGVTDAGIVRSEPTLEALRNRAGDLEIEGRSKLTTREELEAAIANAELERDRVIREASEIQPGTPEEVGLPDLLDVAADIAGDRFVAREIGSAPEPDPEPELSA